MPRIPVITADANIRTGPVAPEASLLAFSGGAGGLEYLGQGIANAGQALGEIDRKKRLDDDNRWNSKAAAQYAEQGITFLHDPANANREDYADISFKFLKEQKAKYLQEAPSSRARQLFSQYADGFANSNRAGILTHTEAVKLTNAKNEVELNVNKAMGAFRQQAATDKVTAALNAEALRQLQHQMLKEMYADIAPAAEKGLREYIDEQFIIGASEQNPDYARRILNESEFIDEGRRKTLGDAIDRIEQRGLRLQQYDFEKQLNRSIEFGFSNDSLIQPVSPSLFTNLYGKENGELVHRKFEDERQEANTAIGVIAGMKDKNASAIVRQVNDFEKTANVTRSLKNLVAQKATELLRQQAQDPAGYLAANNDEVRSAFASFQSAPDEQKARAFQKYADVVLKYQGYGADDRYLNRPTTARHALPEAMAKDWAGRLNAGSYQEKLQTLQQFGALFESYDAWKVGFNDLVTIPKKGEGVKPQYQLALQFLNWKDGQVWFDNPELVQSYLAAVDNAELLKEVGKDKQKYADYSNALDSNPHWQNWARTTYGENWQRADEVAAAKEGLIAYAWARGKTASEGVRGAIDAFITKHQYIGSVNGQPLLMERKRKDGSIRSEDELEDITRRLGVSLKYLDVDQIDKSRLHFVPFELGDNSKEARLHTLRYIISNGFFQPEPDGNAVTLYVMSDNGIPTQLTDRDGRPFRAHFDNLPAFTRMETQKIGRIGPRGIVITSETKQVPIPERPAKSIGSESGYAAPSWQDDEATHWPVRSWMITESDWGDAKKVFLEMMRNWKPVPFGEPKF